MSYYSHGLFIILFLLLGIIVLRSLWSSVSKAWLWSFSLLVLRVCGGVNAVLLLSHTQRQKREPSIRPVYQLISHRGCDRNARWELFKEGRVYLSSQFVGIQSMAAGRGQQEELEEAGHIVSTVRK